VPNLHFSPDGNYFAVWSERGRVDLNDVEDSLRFYRSQDVVNFLEHSDESHPLSPVWEVNRSDKEGPVINDWRWLGDSSGVAFLEGGGELVDKCLVLADLRTRKTETLTSAKEMVKDFGLKDRQHYAYTVADPAQREKWQGERLGPAIIGTGRSLFELLFPNDPRTVKQFSSRNGYLLAVIGGKHFEVKHDLTPLVVDAPFALSPDGTSLVTTLPVGEVPESWEILYPPPYSSSPYSHIHAGRKDVNQYVRINLQTGSVKPLTEAPTGHDAGWWPGGNLPSWSSDGQEILLPSTFIKPRHNAPSRPCVAVVDLPSNTSSCVEILKTSHESDYHDITDSRFARGDKDRVMVSFIDRVDESLRAIEYRRSAEGTWQVAGQFRGTPEVGYDGLEITVKEGLNDPPVLVATKKQASRVIWDANPQLKSFELGEASVYKWKDKEGREWRGGLYKPIHYKRGRRYPLVIQNHGFDEGRFLPSGIFPTGFAARALAAEGIAVLQVGAGSANCKVVTVDEAACMAAGYESAANQLVSEGLADADRIGMIGFSRTCFYVMETLTTGPLHLKAASITAGWMSTYLQYMLNPERFSTEANVMMGAPPFGDGLQQWIKRSPGFSLDKITAPLSVVAEGPTDLLFMWEPYAGLHYLHKAVDLVMLNSDEHVLTNPAVRMASQGGSVDWFRFWLKDEEDPDPAKANQYARWHELRKLQNENEKTK